MSNDPTKIFEQVVDFNRRLTEYTLRFNQATTAGIAPAIKTQTDSALAALESAITHGDKLAQVKSPQEALDEQTALVKDLGENFQSTVSKLLQSQQETGDELKTLLEEGVKAFTPEALSQLLK